MGCSIGTLCAEIKAGIGAQVFGIELSEKMVKEAMMKIDKDIIG